MRLCHAFTQKRIMGPKQSFQKVNTVPELRTWEAFKVKYRWEVGLRATACLVEGANPLPAAPPGPSHSHASLPLHVVEPTRPQLSHWALD